MRICALHCRATAFFARQNKINPINQNMQEPISLECLCVKEIPSLPVAPSMPDDLSKTIADLQAVLSNIVPKIAKKIVQQLVDRTNTMKALPWT